VEFRGRFDNARLSEVYAEIDVLIVPSVWFENSPITIHEAFLTHTPVIASDIGGMAEYVRDGVDGLHFKVGDDADLAAKMQRFLDEPGLVERLSKDWIPIKTIAEDAAVTEFRYRALACARKPAESGARVLFDRPGIDTAARAGPCEQQGADMLLLRADARARAEYDLDGLGGGPRLLRIEQRALADEPGLALGLSISVDGVHVGDVPAASSRGKDQTLAHEVVLQVQAGARRLVLETLGIPGGDRTHARIARVRLSTVAPATAVSA
jgi:hypothetical protein